MREHEVPTHVQAEDRVLLWFTFPQLVAMTAIAALAYGAYRYAPVDSTGLRIGMAIILGLMGMALVVGKVGGRRLPLVVADLLKYRLGPRRWAGKPAELVRPEPPAPVQSTPGPVGLLLKKIRRITRRRNVRTPLHPHGRSGKGRRRRKKDRGNDAGKNRGDDHGGEVRKTKGKNRGNEARKTRGKNGGSEVRNTRAKNRRNDARKTKRNRDWRSWLAVPAALMGAFLVTATGTVPPVALADDHHPDGLGFDIAEPIPGRRVYIEGLAVTEGRATVTVRAAVALDLWVRAYGGPGGEVLNHRETSWLPEGQRKTYNLPLSGDSPSLTFSWKDRLGQTGAVTLKGSQLSHPLPAVEGEFCDLELSSLKWTPGWIEGTVVSECEDELVEIVGLPVVTGHESVSVNSAMEAEVVAITGTITITAGGIRGPVPFVPDGFTRFRGPVPLGKAIHRVSMEADLDAQIRMELPPVVGLTHHPERDEETTKTVSLYRPGTTRSVSETVQVSNPDGTFTQQVISANLSIPGATVSKDVTVTVTHEEHVKAEVTERGPMTRTRNEVLQMTSNFGSDEPYRPMALPEPEPEPDPAIQTPGDMEELRKLFELLGWEWPW